ncbi:MAG: hypothetical protein GF334_03065 [Candidatus Altiarchaeales archaeon]|nr:hypothetical protein [Candidatus Altiarchaeales archaeon]
MDVPIDTNYLTRSYVEKRFPGKTLLYTLGNPEVYEKVISEGGAEKRVGGCVFMTLEDALELLDIWDYRLPPYMVDGQDLPGRVYGIVCNPETDVEKTEEGFRLLSPAPLGRVYQGKIC